MTKQRFFSYGYDKEKVSLLYCSAKKPLPNIFNYTAFKKHIPLLLDENQNQVKSSKFFLYLLSTLDRKEDFLQWKDKVHLHPVDLTFDDIQEAAGQKLMDPSLLDNQDLRGEVVSSYYKIMKKNC